MAIKKPPPLRSALDGLGRWRDVTDVPQEEEYGQMIAASPVLTRLWPACTLRHDESRGVLGVAGCRTRVAELGRNATEVHRVSVIEAMGVHVVTHR